ncbi:MAG TPA: HAMP domain-containing sensor histidine kinase [Alphaproteobacteria bacterium]|nr:HAMP domain-containing sensor histidine kinase [Alphaproteobacteria bacterium]
MSDAKHERRALRHSLSAKLLWLTILFVMVAEVLIFAPSIARFRLDYIMDKISDAHIAALALEATPTHMLSPQLEMQLLQYVDAYSVVLDVHGLERRLMMNRDMPPAVDANFDLRKEGFMDLVGDAFMTLIQPDNRVIRIVGPSPKDPGILVEIVIDEGPMRRAMYSFAWNILSVSIVISLFTAGLVYLSLQMMLVRPLRRITESMERFRLDPEDATGAMPASDRRDEIGIAQRELAQMQTELRAALHQKTRLAALGSAVTKIAHDLRNILATALLVSDRLSSSEDPTVKRVTPTLLASIDRAIKLCVSTLRFAKDDTETPRVKRFALRELVEDAGAALSPQAPAESLWVNEVSAQLALDADRDQLFRVLVNLGRNAFEARATRVQVSAQLVDGRVEVAVEDNGQGIPAAARQHLFQPFGGTAKPGGTGLGLAIARDLLRAHGGDIALVESRPGATRFVLVLPMRRAAAA